MNPTLKTLPTQLGHAAAQLPQRLTASPSIPPGKERFVRLPELKFRVGLQKTSIYSGMAAGTFPACVRIGGRSVAWKESSIDSWIQARTEQATAQEVAE
jgi:prophage regulatory protein